jgi:hypothetical protein
MKYVFFPHTAIEPNLAKALHACLGPVTLFHPLAEVADPIMTALRSAQQIELVFPCPNDGEMLLAALEGLRRWASEHAGQDLAGLMQSSLEIPFFDKDTPARIAAQIKSADAATAETTSTDRLYRARLLLLMAQVFDSSRRELEKDFQRVEAQEHRMLAMLKGEIEASDAPRVGIGSSIADTGRASLHLWTVQVAAWARLALQAETFWRAHSKLIFMTESMDVLDHIKDQAVVAPLLNRHIVACGSDDLHTWLAAPHGQPPRTEAKPATSKIGPVGLTLCRLPGWEPHEWLRHLAGERVPSDPFTRQPSNGGVLVGHVELI